MTVRSEPPQTERSFNALRVGRHRMASGAYCIEPAIGRVMHFVKMEVYELGTKPGQTNRLATAVISKHETPFEAEQMIEQINRDEFPEQPRIETLKKSLLDFYGNSANLAFVYTKQAA